MRESTRAARGFHPRNREGEFITEVFERYKRMKGNVEEAILEMYLSRISTQDRWHRTWWVGGSKGAA